MTDGLTSPDRSWLRGRAEEVAPELLGWTIRVGEVCARIVEVEAYAPDDPASHGHRGPTARSATMFGDAGHAYVYLSYGVHWCLNVVTGPVGVGAAVLIRAAAVEAGEASVRSRRGTEVPRADLLRGPGNLGRGLGLDGTFDACDLLGDGPVRLSGPPTPPTAIGNGPRVGVRQAAARPWRWWVEGAPQVSAYRRHPRAVTPPT